MTAPGKPATLRPQRKPQITGASETMQMRTETPPSPAAGGDPNSCPSAMKPAISPGHSQLRSPSWKSQGMSPSWLTRRFACSSHMTSSGWSMLGSTAMTVARIATAKRQIASNASQSPGKNRSSGDSASRRPAAEIRSSDTPWRIFGRPGLLQRGSGIRLHAIRSSRLDVTGPSGEVKLVRSDAQVEPAQTGRDDAKKQRVGWDRPRRGSRPRGKECSTSSLEEANENRVRYGNPRRRSRDAGQPATQLTPARSQQMTPVDTVSLTVFTVTLAFGQVCFKRVGLTVRGHSGLEAIALVLQVPSLYLALILYGAATLLWIWILSRVNLSLRLPLGRASGWSSCRCSDGLSSASKSAQYSGSVWPSS